MVVRSSRHKRARPVTWNSSNSSRVGEPNHKIANILLTICVHRTTRDFVVCASETLDKLATVWQRCPTSSFPDCEGKYHRIKCRNKYARDTKKKSNKLYLGGKKGHPVRNHLTLFYHDNDCRTRSVIFMSWWMLGLSAGFAFNVTSIKFLKP